MVIFADYVRVCADLRVTVKVVEDAQLITHILPHRRVADNAVGYDELQVLESPGQERCGASNHKHERLRLSHGRSQLVLRAGETHTPQ